MSIEPGYKYLKTYQLATVVYDLTVEFCNIFLSGRDFVRLREQMIQAGRSNKQNIAEGHLEKSLKSYIKLLGVAIASLEELKSPNSPNTPSLPKNSEEAANLILTLGHQQSFLLDRQIKSLEEKFVKEGGYSEKLLRSRLEYRNKI